MYYVASMSESVYAAYEDLKMVLVANIMGQGLSFLAQSWDWNKDLSGPTGQDGNFAHLSSCYFTRDDPPAKFHWLFLDIHYYPHYSHFISGTFPISSGLLENLKVFILWRFVGEEEDGCFCLSGTEHYATMLVGWLFGCREWVAFSGHYVLNDGWAREP